MTRRWACRVDPAIRGPSCGMVGRSRGRRVPGCGGGGVGPVSGSWRSRGADAERHGAGERAGGQRAVVGRAAGGVRPPPTPAGYPNPACAGTRGDPERTHLGGSERSGRTRPRANPTTRWDGGRLASRGAAPPGGPHVPVAGRRHGNAARRDEPGAGTATPRHGHDPVIAARRPDARRDGSETRAGPRHAGGDTSPSTTRNTAQRNDQRDDPEHDHDTPHHETPRTRRDGRQTRAGHKPPTRRDDPTRREGRQARTRPRHAPPRSSTRLAARAARPEPQFLSVVRLPPDRRRARPARRARLLAGQSGPRPLGNTDTFRLVPRRWIPVRSPSALPGAPHPKPVPGFLG